MRVNLQPAYILHSRPYRDSSLLLEAFTAEHGRLSLVARGARRRARGGSAAALLQPFTPLLLSFGGRAELKTLAAAEPAGASSSLRGERLISGLYLNELLVRILHRNDAHPRLFAAYTEALAGLAAGGSQEAVLRLFELTLLGELGYSFDLGCDGASGEPVAAGDLYRYEPGCGMVRLAVAEAVPEGAYSGAQLLAMAAGELDGDARAACKRLLREALAEHLGDQPLRSRELFPARPPPRSGRGPGTSSI